MKDSTKELLLVEFETSWQQLFSIDNRRGAFFNYFNVAFFAVLTFTASVWTKGTAPTTWTAAALSATYILLALMAEAVRQVLDSERAANVRYRHKINLIREIFLSGDDDPHIQSYLKQKEIGIKTFTGSGNEVEKTGGTLKPIYLMLRIQQIALAALAIMIWAAYSHLPKAA